MYYYLQDHSSKSIIFLTDDIFLANNIQSGILDCYLKFIDNYEQIKAVIEHLEKEDVISSGIGLAPNGDIRIIDLELFDHVKEKIKLIRIRKPCFEELLTCVRKHSSYNHIGFNYGDELFIQHALRDPRALEEYAMVLGITPEFAKKELTMISESTIKDNFRIFTVSSMIKEKINQLTDPSQVEGMIKFIRNSFIFPGIPNA